MAAKEVIPFAWKLVGYSFGTAVTLFKAVEREDVEVQLLRVQRDGYYKNLKVLDVNTKVVQPTTAPVAPVKKAAKPAAHKTVAKKSSGKKKVPKSAAKTAKKTPDKKPTTKKKRTTKAAKKKKHPAKDTPKRKTKAR